MKKKFTLEKKMIAQVKFYETLYLIHDEHGQRIYTGSEESAKKILTMLNSKKVKRKAS
jgi:hypothetical protein